MPIALDVITRKKLILVRQLYQRAFLQAEAQHSYVDRILALIGFDLTIETLLKAVVSSVNTSVVPKTDFQAIVQQTDNELASAGLFPVPDKAKIQHVRTLRNDAQHKAKYPNETDVSDCRTYTRDFLQQIVLNVWGVNFDSIRLTDLIQNAEVKELLTKAETKLEAEEHTRAAFWAIAGFDSALNKIKTSIVGTTAFSAEVESEIYWAFDSIKEVLILPVIGLDYPNYIRYKHFTLHMTIHFMADGTVSTNLSGPEPTPEEATFIVNYAINAVLQIESFVGDIDKPFGFDSRAFWW